MAIIDANTGAEGERLCAAENPDIVVLDLNLPDCGGLDVLRRLWAEDPTRRVIVFSMYEDPSFVSRAMDAGAMGYVTKSDDPDALLEPIVRVAADDCYLSTAAARQVALSSLRRQPSSRLSPREREALGLLAEGLSLAQIAERLGVSYRTRRASSRSCGRSSICRRPRHSSAARWSWRAADRVIASAASTCR